MVDQASSPKEIVRAFYESYNDHDLPTSFPKYLSPNVVGHLPSMGVTNTRASWLAMDQPTFEAFPDFSLEIFDQVAEGNKVATRFKMGGTQKGEFQGLPASGKTAFVHATTIDWVENGQIVEHWIDLDVFGWMQQLSS